MRFDIISDTHGYLSDALLKQLEGADVIVHAGDICVASHIQQLEQIAPVKYCLGNNDFASSFSSLAKRLQHFFAEGLRWEICHYEERLDLETCEIAVCGHTHRPSITNGKYPGQLIINPGSPTYPRSLGPSMARVIAEEGQVISSEIILLDD